MEFSREFAIAFPLVLDAVIIVLAVTLLLERALGRRTMTVLGWRFTVRLPSWPMGMLWIYFVGSVAGNVGHAPPVPAAQLVAAVPPMSAALTFHLLLRLLDRAPALRSIAEAFEEAGVDEQERAAARKARRARIKTGAPPRTAEASSTAAPMRPAPKSENGTAERAADQDKLLRRVRAAIDNGEPVTGETIGQWLGLSARTGRRRLAALLNAYPELARAVNQDLSS